VLRRIRKKLLGILGRVFQRGRNQVGTRHSFFFDMSYLLFSLVLVPPVLVAYAALKIVSLVLHRAGIH